MYGCDDRERDRDLEADASRHLLDLLNSVDGGWTSAGASYYDCNQTLVQQWSNDKTASSLERQYRKYIDLDKATEGRNTSLTRQIR